MFQDIFSAGSETTSTALEWAMSELMKNPEKMKKAQDEVRKIYHGYGSVKESRLKELKYLQAVIKETEITPTSSAVNSQRKQRKM